MTKKCRIFLALLAICVLLSGCGNAGTSTQDLAGHIPIALEDIPKYSGAAYVAVNGNVPFFDDSELVTDAFESYSPLDSLGRCGTAYANIGKEIMPTEERGQIGSIKPTGWHLIKYDIVDGNYLYNRCHLIGYQLAGENANERNLITGTRYLNVTGMSPFENQVTDYVEETGNHVLYRVSPIFDGDNLLADGVLMEAKSVEDNGEGVLFNVFCYNIQPGVTIDYASGDSHLTDDSDILAGSLPAQPVSAAVTYVLNTNTNKFHYPGCTSAQKITERNRQEVTWSRDVCIAGGYAPCKNCAP